MRLSNGEVLLGWPLDEHIITAGWTYNDGSTHSAIDLRATVGKPVYAAEDGTVNWVQHWDGHTKTGNQSYGNLIRIRHADYNGQSLETYYAHLSRTCVSNGEKVTEGQIIGYSGESGNCFGAHLHFEVRVARVRYNPLNWLDADFRCANAQVQAHLGKYMSVVRPKPEKPANKLQLITIGPITAQAAMPIWAKASELQLPYKSEWTDDAKTMQRLTIGPASNGDAMNLWTLASVLGAPYSAEYVEG